LLTDVSAFSQVLDKGSLDLRGLVLSCFDVAQVMLRDSHDLAQFGLGQP